MDRSALLNAWRSLSGTSRAAIGLAAVALVVLLWVSPSVISALFSRSLQSVVQAPDDGDNAVLAYNEAVERDIDFISQRSPFFAPVAPRPRVTQVDRPPPNTGPAPPPANYGGPRLVGLVGNRGAMFASPVYQGEPFIAIGDKGLVEVIAIEQPWQAKVRWGGGEYVLNLFDRLEALPVVNFGGATPINAPSTNVFGGGAATAGGDLDFGTAAGAEDGDSN